MNGPNPASALGAALLAAGTLLWAACAPTGTPAGGAAPAGTPTDTPTATATATPLPVRAWSDAYREDLAAVAAFYQDEIAAAREACGPRAEMQDCVNHLRTNANVMEDAAAALEEPVESPLVCMVEAGTEIVHTFRALGADVVNAMVGDPHMTLDAFYARLDGLDAFVDNLTAECAAPMCGTPEGDAIGEDCVVPFQWPPEGGGP